MPFLRKRWVPLLIAIGIALLIPLTGTLAQDSTVTATSDVNLRMRTGPGSTYDELGTIPFGTTVPVLATNRSTGSLWILVDYNGQRGWAAGWLVTFYGNLNTLPESDEIITGTSSPPAQPPTENPPAAPPASPPASPGNSSVTVTPTATLKLRSGPGTQYGDIGLVPAGVTLTALGRSADSQWALVEYNGARGWIAAWLTTINGNFSSVPVSDETGSAAPGAPANPAPPSAPPVAPGLPPTGSSFQLGGQTHGLDNPQLMHRAGMTWVKFQHKWSPGQPPQDVAGRIQQAHANGFRVLLSIPGPLYPTSIDYGAYVSFVQGVAALGADAIEIWNEQNLYTEWPAGQIDPAAYVNNMLAPAYFAIKAANPGTLVVGGALAPTGVDDGYQVWSDARYLAGMRDAGAANYMDCIGVHHNAGATPPDQPYGHPADSGGGHYSWYFQPTFNLYASAFPTTPLCFTELGYLSGEGYGGLPPNFWWGYGTTVGEQAAWLARAAEISRSSGRVMMMIVFNVDFTHWGDDPQAGYAMLRPGGGCPACDSLRQVMGVP